MVQLVQLVLSCYVGSCEGRTEEGKLPRTTSEGLGKGKGRGRKYSSSSTGPGTGTGTLHEYKVQSTSTE